MIKFVLIVLIILVSMVVIPILAIWLIGDRGKIHPSTWKGMMTWGWRSIFGINGIHMYVYGRWTNWYIHTLRYHIQPRLGIKGHKWLRDHYHGKILTHEQAEAIIMHDHDIEHHDLEQIIPYPMVRDLVLKGPPDVVAYDCSCRMSRKDHCEPTQVCMIIGQPFVDFILEHHPKTSKRLTQAEAIELLQAEHKRGHMHSAWFKDACLGRFYVICNCCKCCCAGIESMMKYGSPMMASSGYVIQVDEQRCTTCGNCVEVCPFDALSMKDSLEISWEKCMGCGACTSQCPSEALTLVRDEKKGIPMDVRLMN